MKILFITQDYAPKVGGIETYCTELAENLHSAGYSIDVICPSHKEAKTYTSSFNITRIPIHSSFLFLPLLFLMPFLLRGKGYTHIIYGQWQNALWHLLFPSLAKKYRTVTLVHGRELLTSVLNPFTPSLLKRVFKRIDHAVPNSNAVQTLLQEKTHLSIANTVIHPGANIETFYPINVDHLKEKYSLQNKTILAHITRLVKRKNTITLLSILPDLLKENNTLHLVIGGTGPELENIKQRIIELNIQEHVTLLGFIPNESINEHFNLADMFILPSLISDTDIEGFGIVYVEANCCSIPVIGYRCGGVVDAVAHDSTGILCTPGDLNSLKEAILDLAKNPQKSREMGAAGRERALQYFTWKYNAERFADTLKSSM